MTAFNFIILSLVWVVWCVLHSLMIARFMLELCESRFRRFCRFHRLVFNFVATITFLAAFIYSHNLPRTIVYEFTGIQDWIRIVILIGSILLFIGGALGYDMLYFAGFSQIFSNSFHRALTNSGEFKQNGLQTMIRHPWYLAAILLIWSSSASLYDVDLVTKPILTLYLFIGTLLEERKLIGQFGEQYQQYQNEVSMLFPFKWLISLVQK